MKILTDVLIISVVTLLGFFLYTQYWDDVERSLFGDEPRYTIYLGSKALEVTIADEHQERVQGLSGITNLGDFDGKLFIFDESGTHRIWMKDMQIPLDILWINENLEVIHIEEAVSPDTYPQAFTSKDDARFVLEVNARLVSSIKVAVGDRLLLPPGVLPDDIAQKLRE
jgi:uncharacterized membrane protein (UPF0127 family)